MRSSTGTEPHLVLTPGAGIGPGRHLVNTCWMHKLITKGSQQCTLGLKLPFMLCFLTPSA